MKLDSAVQELAVAIMCYGPDPKVAAHVATLVPPREYDAYYRDIAEDADSFRQQFKQVPGEHTLDLIRTLKERNPDSADFYDSIFSSLQNVKDGINTKYVLSRASAFARRQRWKRGLTKAVELLQEGSDESLDQAEQVMEEAKRYSNQAFDPGTFLHDTDRSLRFLDTQETEAFPFGVKEFDAVGLGPRRKQMLMLIAGWNKGKTFGVIHIGKHSLMGRKRVLHISLEMSEEEVTKRYFAGLFSYTKREQVVKRTKFETNELGQMVNFDYEEIADRPHWKQPGIRNLLVKKTKALQNKPRLLVKQFPTGFLTIQQLINYLDAVESASRFTADCLIVDYPDLMQVDGRNPRHSIGQTYQQLRGIAVERNLAIVVPSQVNTEGATAKVTRGSSVSEDRSKMHIADTVISYSQTDSEHDFGMARLFVDKARDEQKNISVLISQAYAMGQFCVESARMTGGYWKKIESEEAKQTKETNDSEESD